MSLHPEFTDAEWDSAPVYRGPGLKDLHKHTGSIVLDFASLEMIAEAQESNGSFRSSDGLDVLKAPLMLGDAPALFLKVVSLNDDDYIVHRPTSDEVLVVVRGLLTIRNNRFANIFNANAGQTGPLQSGDVVPLGSSGIQLTAHGLETQASSLALSISGIHPEQLEFIYMDNIFTTQREINPAGRVNLPYEK
jgi:hypothetical protein